MEIIMTNSQMGISSLERSGIFSFKYCPNPSFHGFSISQKPILGIALKMKKANHSCFFCLKTPNDGGSEENQLINNGKFLETQSGFQPTFDEYLKAMESVRTGNERSLIRDAKRYPPKKSSIVDGISREPSVEGDEQTVKLGSEWCSHQETNTISTEGDGSSKKTRQWIGQEGLVRGKLGFRERDNRVSKEKSKSKFRKEFSKKGGVGRTCGLGLPKLEYQESVMDLKIEMELGEDDGDGSSKRINRRWENDQASSLKQKMRESGFSRNMKDQRLGGCYEISDAVKSFGSEEYWERGGLGHNGNSTEMQKKQLISEVLQVETRVKNLERTSDFSGISKRVPERKRANVGKFGESEINQSLTYRNKFYRGNNERELVDNENNNVNNGRELFRTSTVERKMGDSEIITSMESERFHGNRSHVRLNGNAFEIGKLGHRSNKIDVRLDRDRIQAEDTRHKISLKSGKFTSGNKVFMGDVDENDLEMERAAFKSFEVFTDVRGKPRVPRMEMEERIQKLAKWLNGTDINVPEWLFSKMMHSADIRFTDHSILRVIQILGTLGNWRRALQVIEWLQSRERFKSYKSRYIYTAALDVLGKAKRPVEALNVFHAMRQDLSSYPDLAAYHCIAVTLGQAGHLKELFDVIDCMGSPPPKKFTIGVLEKWDPQLEPDVVVYNAVLNACARRKQWEGAFWVLQQLKQQGLQPSSTTYGLVMEVMFSCAKYNLVHEFFRKVEKSSIPNSLNYGVLVNTLWREGKTDEAVLTVQDMERRGIVGSASLYYDFARCLCSAGRCQEALMQIDKICKVANKPLVVTYTGLIQSCLDTGNVQNGACIFKQMHKFCSPNLVTCNIMLKAYVEHKMFEDAKDLFQKMLDNSNHISSRDDYKARVIPDNYTFNTMLDSCMAEQKWDEFKNIYQQMFHHGFSFNTKRHLRMILEACRAGKGELLETTWKHLVQAGRVPPTSIIKERFCMKLEQDDYVEAISCITTQPTNKVHAFSEKVWLDLFQANAIRFQKDTLMRFTHELSSIVAGSDQPHPMFQNLITSCKQFIAIHKTAAEIDPIENRRTVLPQLDVQM